MKDNAVGIATIYTALPFRRIAGGHLTSGDATNCDSAEAAAKEADAFGSTCQGAVAFSRIVNIKTGKCEKAKIIKQIGAVPDLAYLIGS